MNNRPLYQPGAAPVKLRPLRVSPDLDKALQDAREKYNVKIMEIFRRAWRAHEKGHVDITDVETASTHGGQVYRHDLGDVSSELLRQVLTVYLNNGGPKR